jgi:acyl-coenzyme A thioesterase PaaI-like protein
VDDTHVAGTARFRRFHLGRNGAAHGGTIAQLFDALLGYTAFTLSGSRAQRTAFLHVDYRSIAVIDRELQVDASLDGIEGRKISVSGRVLDGDVVVAEAHALFVKLRPRQP